MQAARQLLSQCLVIIVWALPLVIAEAAHAQPETFLRYVDGDQGLPDGNGESWATAYKYLQDALWEAAQDHDEDHFYEIWVAAAAEPYRPDQSEANPQGTRDRSASFEVLKDTKVYGGFLGADSLQYPGGETDLWQRDPEHNETVLTGTQPAGGPPGSCGSGGDCFSAPHPPGCSDVDCCATVCSVLPDCCDVTWDQDCADLAMVACVAPCGDVGSCFEAHAWPGCEDAACCGLVCEIDPNCCDVAWIQDCADIAGDNCLGGPGDAYHVVRGHDLGLSAVLDGFTITGGRAVGSGDNGLGGGIFITDPSVDSQFGGPIIARCRITGNRAIDGAGLYLTDTVPTDNGLLPTVVNCAFLENEAQHDGGGAFSGSKTGGTWTNCLFAGNRAANHGGAMFIYGDKGINIVNCTFTENAADSDGSGAGDGGGLVLAYDGVSPGPPDVWAENVILWANTDGGPQDTSAQVTVLAGAITIDYSDVEGGWDGPGSDNLNADPGFVDPLSKKYRLLGPACSPCVDAANTMALRPDTADLDTDEDVDEATPRDLALIKRVIKGPESSVAIVDMGAYELCPWDCGNYNGYVDVIDFLFLLMQWGQSCPEATCDQVPGDGGAGGVGVLDFLGMLSHWGPCGGPPEPVPQSVEECIARFGTQHPDLLQMCICTVDPCEEGCPPENCK